MIYQVLITQRNGRHKWITDVVPCWVTQEQLDHTRDCYVHDVLGLCDSEASGNHRSDGSGCGYCPHVLVYQFRDNNRTASKHCISLFHDLIGVRKNGIRAK